MAAIAVDAGTTVIKAVGYDDKGREAMVVRIPTTVDRPHPGWAEQDMPAVWAAVATSVRQVAEQLGTAVDFLAVTAQGDGSWLVDESGEPTGPAILWNDGRAASIVEQWRSRGILEEAFRINGSLAFSGLPNAVLTWLAVNDPDRLAASAASLTCNGYLFLKLTGVCAVDTSDAAVPFMDIQTRQYAPELFNAYSMPWARRLMPEILKDSDRSRPLGQVAAAAVGLPAGTPVVMASYDVAATSIGAGAVSPGQACSILGTTLCTGVVADHAETTGTAAGLTITLGAEDRYVRALPTLAGGEVIRWVSTLLGSPDPEAFMELAARSTPGAEGLVFFPYLSPAGERAPFLDTEARGSFVGLSLEHRPEHVARAVLEGLTAVIRECLQVAGPLPTELRVCGGGAESPVWLQLIATMTSLPVRKLTDTEVGARGAYLLGLIATGGSPSLEAAAESYVRINASYTPAPEEAVFYDGFFTGFLALRGDASRSWQALAGMRSRSRAIA